ncbi:MAG: hypothetical protein ACRYGG_11840 [Janthinobacterium lividum]
MSSDLKKMTTNEAVRRMINIVEEEKTQLPVGRKDELTKIGKAHIGSGQFRKSKEKNENV